MRQRKYKTDAERQAAYRARQKAKLASLAAGGAEIDPALRQKLKARIRDLEAELARERDEKKARPTPPFPRTREEWAAAKQAATEQRKAVRAAAKAAREAERARQILRDTPPTETPETLAVKIAALDAEVAKWKKLAQDRQKKLTAIGKAARNRTVFMSKRLRRHIRTSFHPDRVADPRKKQLREELSKEFNSLTIVQAD